ncbi:ABC transporter permease [Verminephrobacter aporrectodeae subsp. tuberculatae]|uniref:ABC transporter permease n=1 Tax=Verminephrobacter aporrectodeae TaxID=1110389 RepID=UPI0022449DD6|nr:ABC transporter permease [Verminephrobacter aporrectodeae]MCW8164433.1 ABC transporter permease [Verminephrobacter aporrectodeae subsp. tuberculatae]MCW8169313.1 ABC transporter permease [Verminephrobacter aporrectodeae subsp. tuberculatae]MCW8206638.1 ABC transporter permease [Verminephrobacter aporrectodeae subsp. tuberculatae]
MNAPEKNADDRLKRMSPLARFMARPELGAVAGLVLVTVFFMLCADPVMFSLAGLVNFLTPAAQLGILALGAALLMIGGEFDLSIGSMIAFAGLIFSSAIVVFKLPLIVAVFITLLIAGTIGAVNAWIVLRTGLPSFIVTLAFLFVLRGLSLVGLKWATGGSTQLRGVSEAVQDSALLELFSGKALEGTFAALDARGLIPRFPTGEPMITGIPVEIVWFVLLTAVATWVLLRTPLGNWIFASGGDATAAENSGVLVRRVKTGLFVFAALCAGLVAIITVLDSGSTDARRGFQKEFEAIIAAVIGGCLLTGGYGSAVGAFLGSIIFGMVMIGLTYTKIDQDWYLVFLGTMLLVAVLFNNIIRKRATGER